MHDNSECLKHAEWARDSSVMEEDVREWETGTNLPGKIGGCDNGWKLVCDAALQGRAEMLPLLLNVNLQPK